MRLAIARRSGTMFIVGAVLVLALAGQTLWAQGESEDHRVFPERPPAGFARPPIHLRSTNATTGPTGMNPATTRHAYGFDAISNQGAGQTVGIVDAYDDPNIESDLGVFDNQFGLPACTTANGCFLKVYANGPRPNTNSGWALEISLDVEWAHAIAPQAHIVLVEAASSSYTDLMHAVDVAVAHGASVVSMSFGGNEFSGETAYDLHFNVNGVTFTASSGDSGNGVEYPAASPYVVSVGGTTLNTSGGNYVSETAWSGSGGGLSSQENEPLYQSLFGIPSDPNARRGVPDVSYDANPSTGFAVYDTVRYYFRSGWFQVGGTSAGSPQWAALIAIANSTRSAAGKTTLSATGTPIYAVAKNSYNSDFHDITSGTNGSCGTLCTAVTGFDYITGLGSPQANNLIPALVGQ